MQTLREKLFQTSRFLIGTELVSVRGSMAERSAVKARCFANELVERPDIDWISITDNAGGNPQLAPSALGNVVFGVRASWRNRRRRQLLPMAAWRR